MTIIDSFIVAAIAKWAIFAPVFVPLLMTLGVEPEAVLAAYRIGDLPMNALTPVNAYFALVVGFAQKYSPAAGVGTVVSLMLPYFVWISSLDGAVRGLGDPRAAVGPVTGARAASRAGRSADQASARGSVGKQSLGREAEPWGSSGSCSGSAC